MVKNILIIVIVLVVAFLAINNYLDSDTNANQENYSGQDIESSNTRVITYDQIINKPSKPNEKTIEKDKDKDKEKEVNYISFAKCGVDKTLYFKRMELFNDIDLTQPQLDHMSNKMELCENWFEKLELMEPENTKSLIKKLKKEKELLVSLATLKFDLNSLGKARVAIKSKDSYVGSLALNYLLQFDTEFSKKVAYEMGVQNVNFLTTSDSLIFLYQCRHGTDCSPNGEMMQSICQINPETCGMSYENTVRDRTTINQYDDFLHALNVIDSIINSDWFEQRELLNPSDP